MTTPNPTRQLNWKTDTVELEKSLAFIDWEALEQYAGKARRELEGADCSCRLSLEYNVGGLHVVRRVVFNDGYQWLARLQFEPPTPEPCQRLRNEVGTMAAVRSRSNIPVPRVFAYDVSEASGVGAALMLMEFIPGDTAMDSFVGWDKFYAALADIQVEMAVVPFPKIGTIPVRPFHIVKPPGIDITINDGIWADLHGPQATPASNDYKPERTNED
ncbi:uncharacterized protein B0T15DRAFT_558784 [Chaetomium strumarium]|uniref:Aminoglycoside phosphotransferase domain-containing protein n=1 Tax=Chaetomium strumarium TaxID=1170767 RepID=A0AAJ0GRG1_9PEZI|nr:hypothetical protein B0T15DRAFT_558784 [Chaetomium strumarium]